MTDTSPTAPDRTLPASRGSSRDRSVAIAWILAAAWVALPALRAVFLILNQAVGVDYPDAGDVATLEPQGIFGGATFLVLAALFAALVVTGPAEPTAPSRGRRATLIAGGIGVVGLAVAGVGARTQYSWISAKFADISPDPAVQATGLWAVNVAGTGLTLAAIGVAAWTMLICTDRSRIGRSWAVATGTVAALLVIVVWGLALPAGQAMYVPLFALLAIGFTMRHRRAMRAVAQSAQDA